MKKPITAHSNIQPERLSLGRIVCKRLLLCCTFQGSRRGASSHILPASILVLVCLLCVNPLQAQGPTVDPPTAAPPATTATPPASNLPDVPDFDLGTEEFENFGEEDFQVEEKLSPAAETTVTTIKVVVVAVIVLLFGFIAMKFLRRKGAGKS